MGNDTAPLEQKLANLVFVARAFAIAFALYFTAMAFRGYAQIQKQQSIFEQMLAVDSQIGGGFRLVGADAEDHRLAFFADVKWSPPASWNGHTARGDYFRSRACRNPSHGSVDWLRPGSIAERKDSGSE